MSYARMLGIAVPVPDSLSSLLSEIPAPDFQPKNKTIIVDESVTKDDIQGTVKRYLIY